MHNMQEIFFFVKSGVKFLWPETGNRFVSSYQLQYLHINSDTFTVARWADIAFVRTWYPVQVPQFYNPVTTLLLPPEDKNKWQGMKTQGQLKREKGVKAKVNDDHLYRVSLS